MVQLAEMVVKAAGPSVDVATDLHTRLDKHSAIRLARDLEHLKLMWLEEPVPPENIDVMARDHPLDLDPDLRRRKPLSPPRLPQAAREAGGRHHHARHPEVRRAQRVPQDRRDGRPLLDPLRAPQRVARRSARWPRPTSAPRSPTSSILEFHWFNRDYWSTIITENARHHQERLHRDHRHAPASASSSTRKSPRPTSTRARPGSSNGQRTR